MKVSGRDRNVKGKKYLVVLDVIFLIMMLANLKNMFYGVCSNLMATVAKGKQHNVLGDGVE